LCRRRSIRRRNYRASSQNGWYRLPVVYAAIDGLDYPSIAAMLGVPLGTVKTLIFRGKRMLREEISRRLRAPHGT
jgi:DNA-directed RNA polymerase specialized sigma24 family protein